MEVVFGTGKATHPSPGWRGPLGQHSHPHRRGSLRSRSMLLFAWMFGDVGGAHGQQSELSVLLPTYRVLCLCAHM